MKNWVDTQITLIDDIQNNYSCYGYFYAQGKQKGKEGPVNPHDGCSIAPVYTQIIGGFVMNRVSDIQGPQGYIDCMIDQLNHYKEGLCGAYVKCLLDNDDG